jgi:hypothetical protein
MADSITPPPELVQQWMAEPEYGTPGRVTLHTMSEPRLTQILIRAAQWGADQELEACCEWLNYEDRGSWGCKLRAARRPKPPSLKQQALEALSRFDWNSHTTASEMDADFKAIRRALEALPND